MVVVMCGWRIAMVVRHHNSQSSIHDAGSVNNDLYPVGTAEIHQIKAPTPSFFYSSQVQLKKKRLNFDGKGPALFA